MSVPDPSSVEDVLLQQHQVKVPCTHPKYPKNAMHVFAQNKYCDEWNKFMLESIPGDIVTCVAQDSKKDNMTKLANINIPDKPSATGNLTKELQIKVGAKVMITTNIDVSDGLTNGVMGWIVNIVKDKVKLNVKAILLKFENKDVGQNARNLSLYKDVNHDAVPIEPIQACFQINGSTSCNGTRVQFPLRLSWGVTIHKCQGLTLNEIVVDMTPSKGKYYPGQAYIAFSRVKTLEGLHIINYTRSQIKISPNVEEEMERLRMNLLPQIPKHLFEYELGHTKLVHINIGNIHRKLVDIKCDKLLKSADIISINETHLSTSDYLDSKMLNLGEDMQIYRKDRDSNGGGVALLIHKKLNPERICIQTTCELVSVSIHAPQEIVLICVYQPPSTSICSFTKEMNEVIKLFEGTELCIVGDINEDVYISQKTTCCSLFKSKGLYQIVTKPTCDSGTLIDHVYTRRTLQVKADVTDCYYSDHDFVLVNIN